MASKEEINNLIVNNTKLVTYVISKFRQVYKDQNILEEIIQEGNLALVLAANRYDESKSKFSTFAVSYIFFTIKKYLRESNTIKIPRKLYDNIEIDDGISSMEINKLRNITSLDESTFSKNDESQDMSIHEIVGKSDYYEFITDDFIESFLKTIDEETDRNIFEEHIYSKVYFNKTATQTYLAKKYEVSQAKVSRVINKYMNKLKDFYLEVNNVTNKNEN